MMLKGYSGPVQRPVQTAQARSPAAIAPILLAPSSCRHSRGTLKNDHGGPTCSQLGMPDWFPSKHAASGTATFVAGCVGVSLASAGLSVQALRESQKRHVGGRRSRCPRSASAGSHDDVDVVVIGSGLGGLSCAGVLAAAGRRVTVCESHYRPGGACHTFREAVKDVGEFHFESGPSLYSGLSSPTSPSQLKHVFQIIGEEPDWIQYDRWNAFFPEGEVNVAVGYRSVIEDLLPRYGGPGAVEEWKALMGQLKPLSEAVYNAPPFGAIREDPWALLTLGRYLNRLKSVPGGPEKLSESFDDFLSNSGVQDKFIYNYLSMFCFLLQGLPSYGAPTSMMAYMMADLYRKGGTCLDYPKGGSEAIVNALIRGVTKHDGCNVLLSTPVKQILVEDGRAVGVLLKDGSTIRSKEVVSNADIRVTRDLLPSGVAPEVDQHFVKEWDPFKPLNSFIHIHAAFKGDGLPSKHCEQFPAQWGVVNDWSDLEAPRNMVLVSVPSLLDETFAPPGFHSLHAYTPATEPFKDWASLDRRSEAYKQKKQEAKEFLYSAIERQLPDFRKRVVFEKIGTPLTHERFLRKPEGAYGWRVLAGANLPGHKTPLQGLHVCGDSTYPGIGVPAAAMGGHICANNMLAPWEHWALLDRVPLWDFELEM